VAMTRITQYLGKNISEEKNPILCAEISKALQDFYALLSKNTIEASSIPNPSYLPTREEERKIPLVEKEFKTAEKPKKHRTCTIS
jgi:hypothetical protein